MILSFILGYFFTNLISPKLLALLAKADMVNENYRKAKVINAGGIIIAFGLLLSYYYLSITSNYYMDDNMSLLFGILVITLLGLLDDLIGDNSVKGLKGHLSSLIQGKLTTGGLKALGGALVALHLVIPLSQGFFNIITNWFALALSINIINLLDLRPGRALKGYAIIFLVVLAYALYSGTSISNVQLMIMGSAIAFWPYDLKEQAMLGDTGANVLGLSAGYIAVSALPLNALILFLAFLVLLHLVAEKWSLTKIIEQVSFLRYLDYLGR